MFFVLCCLNEVWIQGLDEMSRASSQIKQLTGSLQEAEKKP